MAFLIGFRSVRAEHYCFWPIWFTLPLILFQPGNAAVFRQHGPDIDSHYGKTCINAGCHEFANKASVPKHVPFLEGACLACHEDHRSSRPLLLRPGGNGVCLQCHTELTLISGTQNPAHPLQAGSCLDCHTPHQGQLRSRLRQEQQLKSCAECHRAFLLDGQKQPYRHQFFESQNQCGNCHYAHTRADLDYLRPDVSETCLTCHDLPIRTGKHQLENVAQRLRESSMVHGAMKDQGCPSCHTPHGSPQSSLLLAGYPDGAYKSYQTSDYALCWKCHTAKLVEAASDPTATLFRNGPKNLHYVHVVQLKRARSCHLCHEPHAANEKHLIRQSIRFGQWNGALKWDELPDGGKCSGPCHELKVYSRSSK